MEQTKPYLANFERFQKETAGTTRPFVKATARGGYRALRRARLSHGA